MHETSKPTDKDLALSVRELFAKLRIAIRTAEEAGLRVEFSDRVEELLEEPQRPLSVNDIKIVRPL